MSRRANLYLGRAGQLAAMAEFLARGWNVAVPEVDVGDDIFVVRDRDGKLFRIQVKTAASRPRKYGWSSTFSVTAQQLATPVVPELTYVFVTRARHRWTSFLVISRRQLDEEHRLFSAGSRTSGRKVLFHVSFAGEAVTCSGRDFSPYLNNWERWPAIEHR